MESILGYTEKHKVALVSKTIFCFLIWHRDALNSAITSNNEKKRGKLAVFLLKRWGLAALDIACCKWLMLSKKNNDFLIVEDQGNTCLLGIDLAILGENEKSISTIENRS